MQLKSRGFGSLEDYPPYITWYDLFMNNAIAQRRMGKGLVSRLKKLILDKSSEIAEIDDFRGFIHSDFRPANMLVDKNDSVYIVDWEYACFGHILADIGQFFRYHTFFSPELLLCFEEHYNKLSDRKLRSNWYALSKLRDLVNPLQMLGTEGEQPNKDTDLIEIILGTLNYFGY